MVAHGHVEMEVKMLKISGGAWASRDGCKNVAKLRWYMDM